MPPPRAYCLDALPMGSHQSPATLLLGARGGGGDFVLTIIHMYHPHDTETFRSSKRSRVSTPARLVDPWDRLEHLWCFTQSPRGAPLPIWGGVPAPTQLDGSPPPPPPPGDLFLGASTCTAKQSSRDAKCMFEGRLAGCFAGGFESLVSKGAQEKRWRCVSEKDDVSVL